jgi:hypothetical protein
MKPFIVFLLVVVSLAWSQDPALVKESSKALLGALTEVLSSRSNSATYLPQYGLHLTLESFSVGDAATRAATISELLEAMSVTLEGLVEGDWVSVYVYPSDFSEDFELLVRLRYKRPDTLEVWVNGQFQLP